MSTFDIIQIAGWSVTFVIGFITTLCGFVKAAKAKKKAQTAEEQAAAKEEMIDYANKLIANAETFFKSLDTVLKQTDGSSAGVYKKENVMTKLESYAMSKGLVFDKEYWSNKVNELVALTKQVNVK